jgi:menaquinone-9 beta-reductase
MAYWEELRSSSPTLGSCCCLAFTCCFRQLPIPVPFGRCLGLLWFAFLCVARRSQRCDAIHAGLSTGCLRLPIPSNLVETSNASSGFESNSGVDPVGSPAPSTGSLTPGAPERLEVDVAIVGAGPAGATAATMLARAGRSVLLIDKATFPRDKCCGDGLTAGALRRLESLGLDPAKVPSWEWVDDVMLVGPKGRQIHFPLPRSQGHFSAVATRLDLDSALVDLAVSAGAIPRFGVSVTAAVQQRSSVLLTLGDTLVSAQHVLAADGMWSPMRKFLSGVPSSAADGSSVSSAPVSSGTVSAVSGSPYLGEWHAMRQYYGNVHTEASRKLWIWFEPDIIPGYVWCFPLADGRVNLGFGIERNAKVKTKTMKAMWASLADRPHIRAVLGPDAVAEDEVKAWPIPADIAHATLSDGRVLFIGDAARACDVLTGEGIGQAIQTGSYAAEAILTCSTGSMSHPRVLVNDPSVQVRAMAQLEQPNTEDSFLLAGPISAPLRVPPERPFQPASRIGDSTTSNLYRGVPNNDPSVQVSSSAQTFGHDATLLAISAHYEQAVRSHLGPDHRMAFALQRMMRSETICRGSLAISGSTNWTRSNFARWLFEDYARGIALTPRRWKRGLMSGKGAYLYK